FIWDGVCYERLRIANYGTALVEATLNIEFDADFVDIFEVRGTPRPKRGALHVTEATNDSVCLSYTGLDGVERSTRIVFSPPPDRLINKEARLKIRVEPKQDVTHHLAVACQEDSKRAMPRPYGESHAQALAALSEKERRECHIGTANPQFDEW